MGLGHASPGKFGIFDVLRLHSQHVSIYSSSVCKSKGGWGGGAKYLKEGQVPTCPLPNEALVIIYR